MTTLPPITVSRADRELLYKLLDSIDGDSEVVTALYEELERASVLEAEDMPADVVALNSHLRFVNEQTGKAFQTQLVLPGKQRPGETVSVLAPAGAALLGLKVGDIIDWPSTGKQALRLKLVEVGNGA